MQLDKDGIITILIGLLLIAAVWFVEFYFFTGQNTWQAVKFVVKDAILGFFVDVGILLVIVGILFMTAW